MKLSDYVKQYRKEHNLSYRAMAEKCDCSFQYLQKLEQGIITKPSYDMLEKIAKGMNMTVPQLVSVSGINPSINSNGETEFWMPKENTIIESQESSPQVERLMDYVTRLAFHGSEKDIEKANDMLKVMFPEYTKDE